jgi:hypothetical protein
MIILLTENHAHTTEQRQFGQIDPVCKKIEKVGKKLDFVAI